MTVGGVLFLHWFDPEAPDGNSTQFASEAEDLEREGIVTSRPQLVFPWSVDPTGSTHDTDQIEAELTRLSVCVDELVARGADRIVLVGHDFGAMHGALLVARDPRIAAGVLIAPANRWADWFMRFWPISEDRIDYMRALRSLDPIEHAGSISPRPLLLQFADNDWFIAGMDAAELYRACGEPRRIESYPADHGLRNEQARADRREFILAQLS